MLSKRKGVQGTSIVQTFYAFVTRVGSLECCAGRVDPDPGANGEVGEHERAPRQRL